jgi:energy-coupling factor transporter ATP-binding protein EcfA2/energy-coupling factor transporter transmembrane protein EcfT
MAPESSSSAAAPRKVSRGWGLGRIRPAPRLAIVFLISVFFIFINNLAGALLLLALGIYLFFANPYRPWKIALAAPISGGMLIIYNTLFSPVEAGGWHWFIFTINQAGLERGLVMGLRLTGVMLISFAWLFCTPLPEMYAGLEWLRPAQPWVLGILRGIQILKREFIALTQSLIIRGLRWDSFLNNIRNLAPLAAAIIPRIVDNSQKAAFASQSHQHLAPQGDGSLQVGQVYVRYAPNLPDVLSGVSLSVGHGEFIYLAGRNKAGKTSLLRLLGGVISWIMGEFRGQVVVSGMVTHEHPLNELCGSALYIAPDPFASIHGLTVGQEISFLVADEAQARQALATMGLDPADLWERETTKLSGGQQVRLVLAGALAAQARLLLLDSPMQELDPDGRQAFLEALHTLRTQRDCTILVADYFWPQIRQYVDRVVVLENGSVAAELPPSEFFDSPAWLERCSMLEDLPASQPVPLGEVVAELQDVYVTLEENPILKGVSLQVRAGEFLAIMGPNGSGKTTAMLTLAGAIAPQKGRARASGRVGYVFQHAALQTVAMTVSEELEFGPQVLKWPAERSAAFVGAGLAWTGLGADECPLDLHPADVRMLEIAACGTDLCTYILDEPTVGLDAAGIARVAALVNDLRARGLAVIVITHDEKIAARADRVITIRDGRVAGDSAARPAPAD